MADLEERVDALEDDVEVEGAKVEEVADDGLEHVREEMKRLWPLGF